MPIYHTHRVGRANSIKSYPAPIPVKTIVYVLPEVRQSGLVPSLTCPGIFCENLPVNDLQTILVVDDDFAMRKGIALMLQRHGYSVIEAADGAKALALVADHAIDLAILDLFLPGQDGLEVAEEIRKHDPGRPIVVITAHAEHQKAQKARKEFGHNFIEKSRLEQVLVRTVQKSFHDSD